MSPSSARLRAVTSGPGSLYLCIFLHLPSKVCGLNINYVHIFLYTVLHVSTHFVLLENINKLSSVQFVVNLKVTLLQMAF